MLDRHAMHALLKAGRSTKDVALQMGVTQRTFSASPLSLPSSRRTMRRPDDDAPSVALPCRSRRDCD
jgi:hypothetical protein